ARPARSRIDRLGLHRRRPRGRPGRQLVDRTAPARRQARRPHATPPNAHRQRRLATRPRAPRDRPLLRNRETARAGSSLGLTAPTRARARSTTTTRLVVLGEGGDLGHGPFAPTVRTLVASTRARERRPLQRTVKRSCSPNCC